MDENEMKRLLDRAKALLDGSSTLPDTWDDRAAEWVDDYLRSTWMATEVWS